jgi:serine/threonine protein kinase
VDYDKIRHEKIIVQNFRTTASPFILKYYNCTQKAFKYRHYLLMDYLGPQLTLSEYNELHKLAFSLHSKMHVFIHLTNALTFLEKQQVVHMDLSSHNVMIYRDLLIKLIDFG